MFPWFSTRVYLFPILKIMFKFIRKVFSFLIVAGLVILFLVLISGGLAD